MIWHTIRIVFQSPNSNPKFETIRPRTHQTTLMMVDVLNETVQLLLNKTVCKYFHVLNIFFSWYKHIVTISKISVVLCKVLLLLLIYCFNFAFCRKIWKCKIQTRYRFFCCMTGSAILKLKRGILNMVLDSNSNTF